MSVLGVIDSSTNDSTESGIGNSASLLNVGWSRNARLVFRGLGAADAAYRHQGLFVESPTEIDPVDAMFGFQTTQNLRYLGRDFGAIGRIGECDADRLKCSLGLFEFLDYGVIDRSGGLAIERRDHAVYN